MEKVGWKVVAQYPSGCFWSFSVQATCMQYVIDVWTDKKEGHGPLAVFMDKGAALNAWPNSPYKMVFSCVYEPWEGERSIWAHPDMKKSFDDCCRSNNVDPSACDLASRVKILEEVWY